MTLFFLYTIFLAWYWYTVCTLYPVSTALSTPTPTSTNNNSQAKTVFITQSGAATVSKLIQRGHAYVHALFTLRSGILGLHLFLNFCLVLAVNAAYVYALANPPPTSPDSVVSSSTLLTLLGLGVSCFNVAWNDGVLLGGGVDDACESVYRWLWRCLHGSDAHGGTRNPNRDGSGTAHTNNAGATPGANDTTNKHSNIHSPMLSGSAPRNERHRDVEDDALLQKSLLTSAHLLNEEEEEEEEEEKKEELHDAGHVNTTTDSDTNRVLAHTSSSPPVIPPIWEPWGISLRTSLVVFNTIVAPYLAEVLVAPTCFYYVTFAHPPSVSSTYTSVACQLQVRWLYKCKTLMSSCLLYVYVHCIPRVFLALI